MALITEVHCLVEHCFADSDSADTCIICLIGIASYRPLGHVPLLSLQHFFQLITAARCLTATLCGCLSKHNMYSALMVSQDTCLAYRRCLETLFFMSRSWRRPDTCVSCLLVLARVLSFHVSSCLTSHDCVLAVYSLCISKCLFCTETLIHFLLKV